MHVAQTRRRRRRRTIEDARLVSRRHLICLESHHSNWSSCLIRLISVFFCFFSENLFISLCEDVRAASNLLKFTRTTNEAITLRSADGTAMKIGKRQRMHVECVDWMPQGDRQRKTLQNLVHLSIQSTVTGSVFAFSRYENENQRIFHNQRPLGNSLDLQCGICVCVLRISRLTCVSNNNSMFNVHRLISCYFWALLLLPAPPDDLHRTHTTFAHLQSTSTYAVYGFHTHNNRLPTGDFPPHDSFGLDFSVRQRRTPTATQQRK